MRVEEVSKDLFWSPFFCNREFFFPKFPYVLFDMIGLENFPLSFSKSKSTITMCNLHRCYTWTALPSANQNQVTFSCILLDLQFDFLRTSPSVLWVSSTEPVDEVVVHQSDTEYVVTALPFLEYCSDYLEGKSKFSLICLSRQFN